MLIGIAGKAGTGKTTTAKLLCSEYLPPEWGICSFADEVKIEASRKFGFDIQLAYSPGGKGAKIYTAQWGEVTVREVLQRYGTDMVRAEDPSHWVRAMDATYRVRKVTGHPTIVDDVRFPNEADWVLEQGGHLVYLMPYKGWIPGVGGDHASETALDEYEGFSDVYSPKFGELDEVARAIAERVEG